MSNLESQQSSNTCQQISNNAMGTAAEAKPSLNSNIGKNVTSENVVERNRANAQHSTGPRDTSKTRFNALKHGIQAKTLTPFDDVEQYDEIIRGLDVLYPIRNPFAIPLKAQIALDTIRLPRSGRIEADSITSLCNPLARSNASTSDEFIPIIDPNMMVYVSQWLGLSTRYETAAINRIMRLLKALECMLKQELELSDADPSIIENEDGTVTV